MTFKKDHYYSNGETVLRVAKVTDDYVVFHEARLNTAICGAPEVISLEEFSARVDHEVEPVWRKVST